MFGRRTRERRLMWQTPQQRIALLELLVQGRSSAAPSGESV